jgi:hypothetical protein
MNMTEKNSKETMGLSVMPDGVLPVRFNLSGITQDDDLVSAQKILLGIGNMRRLIVISNVSATRQKDGKVRLNIIGETGFTGDKQ